MAGCTSEDMMPPVLHMMAKDWCKVQPEKSYVWFFDRQLPGDDNGAWHSSDLWYWFGTLENCWRPMEKQDYAVSNEMATYLCNFVKSGNPNCDEFPLWDKCIGGKTVMCFGDGATNQGKVNMKKLIVTTLTNKPVGE